MRHPTTGLSEDDLSRLTGSSSSSATCGSNNNNSSSSSSSPSSSSPSSSSSKSSSKSSSASPSSSSSTSSRSSTSKSHAQKHHHNDSPERRTHISKTNLSHSHSQQQQQQQQQQQSPTRFTSTYLPEFINPLEWQKSRKRKERLDSSSAATQERKLQRSNSEELLPQDIPCINCSNDSSGNIHTSANAQASLVNNVKAADVIRRVCSEDFKKSSTYAAYAQEFNDTLECTTDSVERKRKAISDENNSALANCQHHDTPSTQRSNIWSIGQPTKDVARRSRTETSPARSQRFSPVRGSNGNGGNGCNAKYRDSDDSECEHERRRSSERFCKTRAPPGRKASGVSKKTSSSNSSKYFSSRRGDESSYKYDLSALKHERRGFVSKKVTSSSSSSSILPLASTSSSSSANISDHNDNNLIDFNNQQNKAKIASSLLPGSDGDGGNGKNTGKAAPKMKPQPQTPTPYITAQEALPWERSVPEDQTPVLSRRYGAVRNHPVDNMETAAKLAKVMPYPQPIHKQSHATQLLMEDDMDDSLDTLDAYRAFTSLENIRTRDLMQTMIPAMMSFQTPDERLKQVNKRLTALKKKLTQLEEAYEVRVGYRPSQAERVNDKYMKNVLAELSKLRKERHELKADPMGAMGLKTSGGFDVSRKLDNMKTTLQEIEGSLSAKRHDGHRSEVLDELNAQQLLQEKTAVQHGLLYFEQLYGRPTTKDERDAARPLYTRYRLLKRLVTRSVIANGAPELPTILEHEAFESLPQQQYSSNNSTDTTNTPSDSVAPNLPSSDDSTTTTTTAGGAGGVGGAGHEVHNENISDLNIEQLWLCLDKTREEKKQLKRTIREYEQIFEEQTGRKMLKSDRRIIDETYAQYKEKKAKTRLLQALIKKQIQR